MENILDDNLFTTSIFAFFEHPLYLAKSSKLGEDKAEPEVVVTVVWRVVVTVRRATVPHIVVPAATTVNAVRAAP